MQIATIICKLNSAQCHKLLNLTSQNNPDCSDLTALRSTIRYVFTAREISASDIRETYSKA